uniref:RRM domain-containing protein n=1 Tax=Periophthalmus magnuspinnatus TaxID=409849 RepID=A0A3B3ZSH4_9GOBI
EHSSSPNYPNDINKPRSSTQTSPSLRLSNGYILPEGKLTPNALFVGGIDIKGDENEMRDFFAQFGAVKEVKIITYRGGICKGYGFVYFSEEVNIQSIIDQPISFKGRKLKLGPAIMKERSASKYCVKWVSSRQHKLNALLAPQGLCLPAFVFFYALKLFLPYLSAACRRLVRENKSYIIPLHYCYYTQCYLHFRCQKLFAAPSVLFYVESGSKWLFADPCSISFFILKTASYPFHDVQNDRSKSKLVNSSEQNLSPHLSHFYIYS